ncbi:MAG: transporter [Sulfuricurvum sp.]|uniref:transporter n=1 Tax=Sulfuricurvum sp. TaxID=2025608 RepID=UPI0025ED37EF|nr:transporter [Sulfuricurvum sp.]MBV5320950.1 transporter [Sulfuricurvum sp.]
MKNQYRLVFLLIPAITSFGSEHPIVADRPGFSTGTQTLKPNTVNVELGYQYAFNNHDTKLSSHTFPLMVLRTGLSEKAELDLLWDGLNVDKEEQPNVTSKADLSIGGKYKLYESAQYNFTALGILSLPTGTTPSTSDSTDPLVGILWDYAISDNNTLFGTLLASSSQIDHNRVYDTQFAIGTSINHTEIIGSFIEIYTVMPSEGSLHDIRVLDGGMTYLLNNDIQLDFNIGVGLTRYSSNFIGFGIASRF